MTPTFCSCFLLSLVVTLVSASPDNNIHIPSSPTQRFIESFNLFPELHANIIENEPQFLSNAPNLVEKNFRFPYVKDNDNVTSTNNSDGTSVEDFGHHAGYYRLPHTKGARMFYLFFESRSRNSSEPVVVWLSGGPGCSGSLALFHENGPFKLTNDLSLVWNEFGWDKVSNLIYIDQPIGTGFTYTTDEDDLRSTSEQAAGDFYDFLQAFFENHPQYAKNDFYITGESYAGHYIPAFASLVQQRNKNNQGLHINLKGCAIGNGLTNPEIQQKAYPDYALAMKLINKSLYHNLGRLVSTCERALKRCDHKFSTCADAYVTCGPILDEILNHTRPNLNYYDIRKQCEGNLCYDYSAVEKFLNLAPVKKALGVGNITFVSCAKDVYATMYWDVMRNFATDIPTLLQDGIRVLIYAGEYDLLDNWLGNLRWVNAMEWSDRRAFLSTRFSPFKVVDLNAGIQKNYGPLTFLKVYNAGHQVPMDQPKVALEMLTRWIQGNAL